MKKEEFIDVAKKIIAILVASFICALSMKLIVQPSKFLSGGVSGVTNLISRYFALKFERESLESLLYSVLYVVFNVPIFIFGFKKLGKMFILYSTTMVLFFSMLVSLIPSAWVGMFQLDLIDPLTRAILAGLINALGSVIAFSNGFSQGGIDIISMHLSRTKGKGIGNYSLAMNALVLICGGIVFKDYASLIYTVIYFFTSSLTS